MKTKSQTDGSNFGVLKLNVERLRHIRQEQAACGGHFVEVAQKLGYVHGECAADTELRWLEAQLNESERLRRRRGETLEARLRAARDRLRATPKGDPRS